MGICNYPTTTHSIEVQMSYSHDDVIKWRHFPLYWPFVRGIHRSPVNSPHKGQWCRALMFPLICAWIHGCAHNREAGDSRRHRAHYDITVMCKKCFHVILSSFIWLPWFHMHFKLPMAMCPKAFRQIFISLCLIWLTIMWYIISSNDSVWLHNR